MKLLAITSLLVFSACVTKPKGDSGRFIHDFGVQEIARDTYVVVDKTFYDSNVLVAKMKDGSVLIASSPYDTEGGRDLIAWIREKWRPTKIIAVNTHFHSDGTGSNEAFKETGVEIWAGDLTDRTYRERGESAKALEAEQFPLRPEIRERIARRKVVFADRVFGSKKGHSFVINGERVLFLYPGAAHTIDNTLVYLPDRKVLYGTCMVRGSDSLGYTADADLKSWPSAIEFAKQLGAKIVIPGHGPVGGPELLDKTLELAKKAAAAPMSK